MSMEVIAAAGWATALLAGVSWFNMRKQLIEAFVLLEALIEKEIVSVVTEMKKGKDEEVKH